MTELLPIFPLSQMPLPGVRLPLRIFEQRYLSMISRQLRAGAGFVVAQIYEGAEVGQASFFPLAVEVAIVDWDPLPDGLLGLTIEGRQVVRIHAHQSEPDGLVQGQCERLGEQRSEEPLDDWDGLLDVLSQLKSHPSVASLALPEVTDANALGWQLLQLLPLEASARQKALPLSPADRLVWLSTVIDSLSSE
ncbi:LON peptidase substrate-binding domain-containing protein [Simiduia sp. 21SJ11W-1]|uniref:LON peptidase substrate-binding domain-containing protein n=1 Tax=Simiduia sp. 21SJ11W-1 TaxID=2909669 RepID=UPI0020A0EB19|nr:LON peptidase substrate-binding domain-containing protein [Simiduia sp. 21SJ11W-1]UTA48692.1 LON peptidase substrate-binding domain-containing protein [Simiduia sp. 21SJ11W-1]